MTNKDFDNDDNPYGRVELNFYTNMFDINDTEKWTDEEEKVV